jgi:predicted transcriptional regulator
VKETGRARKADPPTAKAAARSVDATDLEQAVLAALLTNGPMTTHEVARYLNRELVTVSPRMAPLVRKGLVQDSTLRREGPSGRKSIVWRIIPKLPAY